ncbi:MAG: ABC transporter ATP-binding protein [Oscillospiraceae bacterium]
MANSKSTRIKNTFRLITSMKPYRGEMICTIISAFLKHIGTIGAAAVISYMVALAMEGCLGEQMGTLTVLLVTGIILRAVMYYSEMWFGHDVAFKVLRDFRIRLYDKIEAISPAYLLKHHSGQIGATLMSDVEILEWFLAHTFGSFIVGIGVTILLLVVLAKIHILLAALMLIFAILTIATPFFMQKKADAQGRIVREQLAEANSVTIDGVQGLREILTLNYLERYKEKNRNSMQKLYEAQHTYGKRTGTENMLMQMFVGVFTVSVMAIAAVLVANGTLHFSVYPVVVMLSSLLFSPLIEVCGVLRSLGNVFAAADRIQRVFDESPAVDDKGKPFDVSTLEHRVVFENVSFRYDETLEKVLHSVSFTVEPGQTVALVGPSGAGKSTCTNLLLRYWDPEEGSVSIGGINLKDMTHDNLRDMTAAVLQDVYLFNVSVMENIRLGKPNASDEEIEQAAKTAYAHNFIMELPEGYNTLAGERGFRLSGGQRQRIAIARAILKNPPILIMDEAVSSLDTENEMLIQEALVEQAKSRTTIVVAHRLSTIASADKVVLICEGNVLQVGTHEELLKGNEFYRNLLKTQLN